MTHMKDVTPFVMVADLDRAIRFYERVLGFKASFVARAPDYAYIKRDSVALRLLGADYDLHDPKRQQSCYIDVTDVNGLYAELKPALDGLPQGRVRAPFDQPYGQREFHVIDEDALLLFFGEPIGDHR